MDTDYTPNSHKYRAEQEEKKEEKEKLEPVVNTATRRRRSGLSKIRGAIVSDGASNVGNHVVMDVLIPAFKNALSDVVTDGINMILFGDTKKRERGGYSRSGYYSYDTSWRESSSGSNYRNRRNYGYDFDEVFFDSRGDAEAVLDRMNEILAHYGIVRVADFYELSGLECQYTDNKYGWSSIRTAEVIHGRDGYYIRLPKAMPIE